MAYIGIELEEAARARHLVELGECIPKGDVEGMLPLGAGVRGGRAGAADAAGRSGLSGVGEAGSTSAGETVRYVGIIRNAYSDGGGTWVGGCGFRCSARQMLGAGAEIGRELE